MKTNNILLCLFVFSLVFSCTNPEQIEIGLTGNWKFQTGDNLEWAKPSFDDANWDTVDPSVFWEKQGYADYDGYAWYRISFYLPLSMKIRAYLKDSIQIVLGKIDDTDQTFLNGQLVGQNAVSIPLGGQGSKKFENDSSTYNLNRVYKLAINDKRLLWDKENTLAIRVHDHLMDGGLYQKQRSISIVDVKDYLVFDFGKEQFEYKSRNKVTKNLKIKNISTENQFHGLLKVQIKLIGTDTVVFEKSQKAKFKPGESRYVAINFEPVVGERYMAKYSFREKNTGQIVSTLDEVPYLLTPAPPKTPKINGAKIFGVRFGNPVVYTVAASGERPMRFYSQNLPYGLKLDSITGQITGQLWRYGEHSMTLIAKNKLGEDSREFRIIVGNKIALTPPMGWNSWNVWGLGVDSAKVHDAAKNMVSSGLANHGWTYINIDDGWEADKRTLSRELLGNEKFRNMRALSDSIHKLGLKFGIYSSPGPQTCGGYMGSHKFEYWDVWTWYKWQVDYVKYDWCSYSRIAKDNSLPELQKPYVNMKRALSQPKRDVVYSICQYGMGDVWKWGEEVGGNLWRTTGDITDTWESMSEIGFNQHDKSEFAKPGHWNDPDMLVVGRLGWGKNLHSTGLTASEQYTHISLWCLLSAPLLLGCDLSKLDDFTLNLLTNDEVLAINQDPLGKQASRIFKDGKVEAWGKMLEDSSMAIGFFNRGEEDVEYKFSLANLNLSGSYAARDLWRQKNLGNCSQNFEALIPKHGVVLVKFGKTQ